MAERAPVQSSSIVSLGYEPGEHDRGVLEVEFASGKAYCYHGVPRGEFDRLKAAASVGRHFHVHIKSAGYAVTPGQKPGRS